ncbi:MAG: hypothetical protein WBE13_11915 [Candidatus Acidiferrum sp.]
MRNRKVKRLTIQAGTTKTARNIQTTLRLPRQLYERVKGYVDREQTRSVNDFIVNALAIHVRALERKAIDDSFQGMAEDKQYQREALRVAEQFARSDAEAIELSERDLVGH